MCASEDSLYIRFFFCVYVFFPGLSEEGGALSWYRKRNEEKKKKRENNAYITKKDVADVAGTTMDNERNTEDPGVDPARILPDLACECSSPPRNKGMERDEGERWGGGGVEREENGGLGEEEGGGEGNRVGGSIGKRF